MAIVTPTDRPKSVRNRRVIEVFGRVFVLSRCFLDFFVGVGAFVIGLSQISFFFSDSKGCLDALLIVMKGISDVHLYLPLRKDIEEITLYFFHFLNSNQEITFFLIMFLIDQTLHQLFTLLLIWT